ncbi:NAD-dependent protein deacetylase [Fulvimonas yonginensis]|uniref:NAD-dependent protein deacetylase n=1 Tax=Fulvimonas yonginensis TaxID=1495200 RepID=A0ABU8JD15_9GAMM
MHANALARFVETHPRLFVLTGAGCSTDSGIPDYRDADGAWKRTPPISYQAFMGDRLARKRYWARSLVGWRHFGRAEPNGTHRALRELEAQERLSMLVTQNVDGLHQRAGSRRVIDLHGRLDQVRCMACELRLPRTDFQHELEARNPAWAALQASEAPDGDADLDGRDFERFAVPPCPACGGVLKPDVVFFGENVPRERVATAMQAVVEADAVLVVGSSLMVFSGYRFVHAAARAGKPVAAVNLGRTRADPLLSLKVEAPCAQALSFLLAGTRVADAL